MRTSVPSSTAARTELSSGPPLRNDSDQRASGASWACTASRWRTASAGVMNPGPVSPWVLSRRASTRSRVKARSGIESRLPPRVHSRSGGCGDGPLSAEPVTAVGRHVRCTGCCATDASLITQRSRAQILPPLRRSGSRPQFRTFGRGGPVPGNVGSSTWTRRIRPTCRTRRPAPRVATARRGRWASAASGPVPPVRIRTRPTVSATRRRPTISRRTIHPSSDPADPRRIRKASSRRPGIRRSIHVVRSDVSARTGRDVGRDLAGRLRREDRLPRKDGTFDPAWSSEDRLHW